MLPFLPYYNLSDGDCVHQADTNAAVSVEKLRVSYRKGFDAVASVTFSVGKGQCAAITGHNGSGKSSVIKSIAGIVPHQGGTINIAGHSRHSCHQRIAYLAQRSDIDWDFPLRVRDLLMQGRYVHLGWLRRPAKKDFDEVESLAEKMGLTSVLDRQISELSGGQQQRALLCRALIQEADILLLDEPFNGLDPGSRQDFYAIFRSLAQEGKTLLIATHELANLEKNFDLRIELYNGTVESVRHFCGEEIKPGEEHQCSG